MHILPIFCIVHHIYCTLPSTLLPKTFSNKAAQHHLVTCTFYQYVVKQAECKHNHFNCPYFYNSDSVCPNLTPCIPLKHQKCIMLP